MYGLIDNYKGNTFFYTIHFSSIILFNKTSILISIESPILRLIAFYCQNENYQLC